MRPPRLRQTQRASGRTSSSRTRAGTPPSSSVCGRRSRRAARTQNAAVWRARDATRLADFGNLNVDAAVFSADGARLLAAAEGEPVRIYDAATAEVVTELLGHAEQPLTAGFSPDGTFVLTTALDGSMRIWDAASGEEITAVFAPLNSLVGAAFDETGTKVVAWGEGVVRTYVCIVCGAWDELRSHAVGRVTRELRPSELRLYVG